MTEQRPHLTIGIDARAAAEVPAGRGRVVRELLRELASRPEPHRYVLYARSAWEGAELDERFQWRLLGAPDPLWHLRAARAANRECDVFLSTNSYLTVWMLRVPAVPIVYDMVPFEPAMRPNRRSTLIERLTLGPAVSRSRAILAISHATADALAERFPRARGITTVMPLGVAPALSADRSGADDGGLPAPGFVLAVGTLEPRKNLPRLVDAYAMLPAELQSAHPLVAVGALGWQTGETLHALESLRERAIRLGYVPDEQLAELYRRCAVFCYPSLGEGFGLPVLEAMAAGAPVLTSNVSSLPEVGGDAVAYADPHSADDIARALRELLESPGRRAELSRMGPQRAAGFSWQAMTETVLGVCEQAAGAPSAPRAGAEASGARTAAQRVLEPARRAFYNAGGPWYRCRAAERLGSRRWSAPALYGMDRRLAELVPGPGVFLEAGGHDGYTQSNTYYLERFHGWSGVLVEPVPELYGRCVQRRSRARVFNCALVGPQDAGKPVRIQFGDLMSKVGDDGSHAAGGLAVTGRRAYEVEVPGRTLTEVLREAGVEHVDVLVLDVEGNELPALAGLDLDVLAPAMILVETLDRAAQQPGIDAALASRYDFAEALSPYDLLYRLRS